MFFTLHVFTVAVNLYVTIQISQPYYFIKFWRRLLSYRLSRVWKKLTWTTSQQWLKSAFSSHWLTVTFLLLLTILVAAVLRSIFTCFAIICWHLLLKTSANQALQMYFSNANPWPSSITNRKIICVPFTFFKLIKLKIDEGSNSIRL